MTEMTGAVTHEDAAVLQAELAALRRQMEALEQSRQQLEARLAACVDTQATPTDEAANTLSACLRRAADLVRGEKCVVLLYQPLTQELVARPPAINLTSEELAACRMPAHDGIAGAAFTSGQPVISADCPHDPRARAELVSLLGIRNALAVPLMTEQRDASQQVINRQTLGILYVFNKQHDGVFTTEDGQVLTVLAHNAAAIIASAHLQQDLAGAKQQLEYTLASLTAGLLAMSPAGRLHLINAAARRILRLSLGSLLDQPFTRVIPEPAVTAFLAEALQEMQELTRDIVIAERCYQAQTAIIRDEEGTAIGLLCVFHDVTELRALEQLKRDFISTVSHELRTPLTAIKGFIRTLLDDPAGTGFDQATRLEFYGIIDTECDRLTRLINDLLNVSRLERGAPLRLQAEWVEVATLVERCVAVQRGYTERHRFVVEMPAELPPVWADRDKLDEIFTNLLNNAVKYSPDGGTITVSITDDTDSLQVTVRDTGMGIPPEHLPHVFQRFYRVDHGGTRQIPGAGIGLFLVKSLVEAHGGTIRVESTAGAGTAFQFTLPRTKAHG